MLYVPLGGDVVAARVVAARVVTTVDVADAFVASVTNSVIGIASEVTAKKKMKKMMHIWKLMRCKIGYFSLSHTESKKAGLYSILYPWSAIL